MMNFVRNPKDVLSGLLFIGLSLLFWWQTRDLSLGSSIRMGPGYFPLMLCGMLALLGLITLVNGLRLPGAAPSGIAWRGLVVLTVSIVFFGATLKPLGFVPSLAITVFLSTLASPHFRILTALVISAAMTVFAWAVFILGLGMPLQLFGPWLGGH